MYENTLHIQYTLVSLNIVENRLKANDYICLS